MTFWYCLSGFFHKGAWQFSDCGVITVRATDKEDAKQKIAVKAASIGEDFCEDIIPYDIENPRGPFSSLTQAVESAKKERREIRDVVKTPEAQQVAVPADI